MRAKAKVDPDFRQRVLDFIDSCIQECIPEALDTAMVDEDFIDTGITDTFEPFLDPTGPNFEARHSAALNKIVKSRQMHSRKHMPTCFKYGSRKCRARFPRRIAEATSFDEDTQVFRVKRNHRWVNNYNKWIAMMTRSNHDCQFLFTKNHAHHTIHYVMKYITKPETALHAKLTIAAAVHSILVNSLSEDIGKQLVLKIYNKIESYREVSVPEVITHMLSYPDHYTDAIFANIHTTHLLHHI